MINLQNKRRSDYEKDGGVADIEEMSKDYWNRSRDTETKTIEDLEKHLWLANAAAATVSIGYIQAKDVVLPSQYYGAWAFVSGILMLVVMKLSLASIVQGTDSDSKMRNQSLIQKR